MSDTSVMAIAATMPPVNTDTDVELRLLYNPFQPETVEVHPLQFQEGQTMAGYLGDLPSEAEYMLFHNGVEVTEADTANIRIERGDAIGVILLPLGGGGLKSVLRMVTVVAFTAVGFAIGGPLGASVGAALGGLVSGFLFKPKGPKSEEEENVYGIDGAKNSATEGIPYPIVYGEFRQAGNFADTYTENVGDIQYLYLRSVLSDGEIDSVSDIEVNEQPVTNFQDVDVRVKNGTLTETPNDWFRSSIRQVNKGIKIDTAWTSHITTAEVDLVRFDVSFPTGLVTIGENKGHKHPRSVVFQMEYRKVQYNTGTGTWDPVAGAPGTWGSLPSDGPDTDWVNSEVSGPLGTVVGGKKVKFKAKVKATKASLTTPPAVEYRAVGSPTWSTALTMDVPERSQGFVADPSLDGSIIGPTDVTPQFTAEGSIDLPAGNYEFRGVNEAEIEQVTTYPTSGAASVTVTDSRTRTIRKSFTSERLDRGYYEVRIRRTNATGATDNEIDEVYLTDIAEIDADPVPLRGTANLSMKIKVSEQLNGVPAVTAKVKGALLQEYDSSGNPTVKRWSANPAWIGLDIMCGIERGAGISTSRIDWPRWVEFAEWCDANNIQFNGVFATDSNMADALRTVLRVGQAALVPFGTRFSVAIDRSRQPVTVFTQASMVNNTFAVNYLSLKDRANEFEVSYFDKLDRNKQKTIRYVDPKAVTFNEVARPVSIELVGVDNIAQATAELWKQIYQNRLIIRQVQFESFMEAINLSLGEVALIQHNMMDWAYNGRLASGSTVSQLFLDQKVEMAAGTHSVLVHLSSLRRVPPRAVSSVVGNKVLFARDGAALTADQLKSTRLVSDNGEDIEIIKLESGATYHTATLASPPAAIIAGDTIELFQTDVVEEREVTSVTQLPNGTTRLNLATPLTIAPDQYASFVFGKVLNVRKPYVLTGMSGSGVERRKLTFMEYHEGVYGAPEVDIPIPVTRSSDVAVGHVEGLLFDYERVIVANKKTINVRVFWNANNIPNYAGADVFVRLNGSAWSSAGSVSNVSEISLSYSPDDIVEFKVVAFSTAGNRAPAVNAPTVKGTLAVTYAGLNAPTDLVLTQSLFEATATVEVAFTPPTDASGVTTYQVEHRLSGSGDWVSDGMSATSPFSIQGLVAGSYDVRVRSTSETSVSVWLTGTITVAATPGSIKDKIDGVEAGANVTETHVAAAITGQSAWATYGSLPPARLEGLTNGQSVTIYKRSITTPALPSASATVTFATAIVTGLTNGWTTSIPASDGNPLWISQAPAVSTGTTATILAASWDAPRALADDKIKTFYADGSTVPTETKDWAFTSALPSGFTVTRSGLATRVNASGYIEDVGGNLPRFDHNPVTLAAKGMLFEEARTNLLPFSEEAASCYSVLSAAWSSNTQTSPRNTTGADTLTAAAGLNRHIGYQSFTGTAATYAYSVFFKQGTARYVQLQLADDWAAKKYGAVLDTQTGTVTTTNSTGSPSGTSNAVENYGNGWYRLTVTMTLTAGSPCYAIIGISNSGTPTYDSNGNPSFTAAGTETIHVWGTQLEVGAFATSYIPNTSTGTTFRGNEYADLTGTNFSSWFTSAQGSFYIEAESYKPSYNATAMFVHQGSGSDNSGILVAMHDFSQVIWFNSSGGLVADLDHGSTAASTYYKYAGAWSNNDFASSRDGGAALTDTAGTYGTTATLLRIGMYRDNQYPLNGHVKAIKFWNTRVANAGLEALSAGGTGGTAPTASAIGDVWYNTSEGNKPYRWSGSAWEPVQDTAIGIAQATADGKNKTFPASAVPPSGAIAGDLWPDTSSSPTVTRRFDGVSTWTIVSTVGAQAGTNLYRTDGTTVMSQSEVRTAEGTSAAIAGQGALATLNTVNKAEIALNAVTAPYFVSTGAQTLTASTGFGQAITGLSFSANIPSGEVLDLDLLTFPLWSGNDGTRFSLDARLMRDGVQVASFGQIMDTNDIATNNQGGFAVPVGLFARVDGNGSTSTYSVELQLYASRSESNSGGSKTFVAPLDIRLNSSQLRARRYSR